MNKNTTKIIPVYTTRGDAEVLLAYPYLYNMLGEWVGWVTPERDVYSVLGHYVGYLSKDPRILRKRVMDESKPRRNPPPIPPKVMVPATFPLARMMSELLHETIDVLLEEPERLHTQDSGELRDDLD